MTPSWTVVASPSEMMSLTRRSWKRYDGPRSPVTKSVAQLMYWMCNGWSRPYSAFSRATTEAGRRFSLSHGPPGTECMSTNVITETANRTGMIQRIRRVR